MVDGGGTPWTRLRRLAARSADGDDERLAADLNAQLAVADHQAALRILGRKRRNRPAPPVAGDRLGRAELDELAPVQMGMVFVPLLLRWRSSWKHTRANR